LPTPADTPPASPDVPEIEVQIHDGAVQTEANTVEVAPGEAIRIVVTSDVDDELHVHGVDQTAVLVAGEPTTLELVFDEPGVFEVETHDGGLLLLQLSVR
jgi:plastocyanin